MKYRIGSETSATEEGANIEIDTSCDEGVVIINYWFDGGYAGGSKSMSFKTFVEKLHLKELIDEA